MPWSAENDNIGIMLEATSFVPESNQGHRWGFGTFYDVPPINHFTPLEKTLLIAQSAGCPIPQEVISRKGLEAAGRDYAVINQIYRDSLRLVARTNPPLFIAIDAQARRLPGEEVGCFEDQAVPKSHLKFIAPKARIYGFASSRLIRDAASLNGDKLPGISSMESAITQAAATSETEAQWLAKIADQALIAGVEVPKIFGYLYSSSQYREEQTMSDFVKIAQAVSLHTPYLDREFGRLLPLEFPLHGITQIESYE